MVFAYAWALGLGFPLEFTPRGSGGGNERRLAVRSESLP